MPHKFSVNKLSSDFDASATTYSKSALRVAAGEAARQSGKVAYFPSYEIITGNFTRGRYYADDLREVREEGVRHVMRLFMAHYAQSGEQKSPFNPIMADMRAGMDIVCDEEEIGRSVQG